MEENKCYICNSTMKLHDEKLFIDNWGTCDIYKCTNCGEEVYRKITMDCLNCNSELEQIGDNYFECVKCNLLHAWDNGKLLIVDITKEVDINVL